MTVSQELEAGSLGHATRSLVNMLIAERLVYRDLGWGARARDSSECYQSKGLGNGPLWRRV